MPLRHCGIEALCHCGIVMVILWLCVIVQWCHGDIVALCHCGIEAL